MKMTIVSVLLAARRYFRGSGRGWCQCTSCIGRTSRIIPVERHLFTNSEFSPPPTASCEFDSQRQWKCLFLSVEK
ncbi:hypothetical protein DPMN_016707 [Dreissena polymorpha]|uniref:Uncharacterized protein n=1 Tax=Dreissena polymorpha TaxID=45954 RepID=A0A9D4NE01_DREPO|nr:hypothetical protein DPMN_016707 [Dreissena polymorpha]